MNLSTMLIAGVALALFIALPAALCIAGSWRAPAARAPARRWNIRLSLASMLLYVLAFNLTFFIQEFFLALPKALTAFGIRGGGILGLFSSHPPIEERIRRLQQGAA